MSKRGPQVEGSSEYHGPRDFTMNLESWIRGSKEWQKDRAHPPGDEEGDAEEENSQDEDSQPENELDEIDTRADTDNGPQEKLADESDFEPLSTSTPAPWANQEEIVSKSARSAQDRKCQALPSSWLNVETPAKTPGKVSSEGESGSLSPLCPIPWTNQKDIGLEAARATDDKTVQPTPVSRLNTGNPPTKAAQEVGDQISTLQAEVEKLRLGDESNRYIHEMLKRAHVSDQEENGRLKTELQNVKEEAVKWQAQASALEKAAAMEQKARDDANAKVGSLQSKLEPLVQELADVRSTSKVEKNAAEVKIAELEEKVRASKMELVKDIQDHTIAQNSNQDVINHLRSKLEDCKRELSSRQQSFEAKLRASEKETEKARDDLNILKANHEVDLAELRLELSIPQQALETRVNELMERVQGMKGLESSLALQKMELDHARDHIRESKCRVETVESENEKLKQARHTAERVEYDRDRFTEEIERLQKENAELSNLLGSKGSPEELEAAKSTITKLRYEIKSHQTEKHAGTAQADALESALATIDQLKDELNSRQAEKHMGTANVEAVEAALEQKHQVSLKKLRIAHEKELKVMNAAILRVGDSMRERELQNEESHCESVASLQQKITSLEMVVAAGKSQRRSQRESLASLRQEMASLENARTTSKKRIPEQQAYKKLMLLQTASRQEAPTESIPQLRQKIASLEKAIATAKKPVPEQRASQTKPVLQQQTVTEKCTAEIGHEMSMLDQKYSAAIASLHATRLALTKSKEALVAARVKTKNDLEATHRLRQELEAEFKETMDEREKEWRRRMTVMLSEREKMGKALLWAWGKEEIGGDKVTKGEGGEQKQGFRYRYV